MDKDICQQYLDALNESDLEKVLSLFTRDAVVSSPLYGEIPANTFYRDLFSDTKRSETKLLKIFDSTGDGSSVALHFRYTWTLQSGKVVEFECVDIFEVSSDGKHFTKLKIIYDTYPIRAEHSRSQNLSKKG
jgi:ketosteroid isomerase-like protein